jgi:hypothetical protein
MMEDIMTVIVSTDCDWATFTDRDVQGALNDILGNNGKFQVRYAPSSTYPTIAGAPVTVDNVALTDIADAIIAKVIEKNHDYGDAWQALGKVGAAARFVDKMFRIEHLAGGQEALVLDEKFSDTVSDLVGYGLLIILYEQVKGQGNGQATVK